MKLQPTACTRGSGFCIGERCDTPCQCNSTNFSEEFYLSDVSPTDKKWDERKQDSQRIKQLYKGTCFDCYADRIEQCSGFFRVLLDN